MATAKVIHFGSDDCHRVQVLRQAGYEVCESESLERLPLDLEGDGVDAVIVSEVEPRCAEKVAILVRQHSGAPLILFRCPSVAHDESRFDRVYDSLVPTADWLSETAELVVQSKHAASERLQRREAEGVRVENQRLRA
jgi:hypothetical protein